MAKIDLLKRELEIANSKDGERLGEFLSQAGSAGQMDSSGHFTVTGKEVVEKIGRCLLDSPTAWILLLVQAANCWKAERIAFTFPSGGIRIEFRGVGDRREWLDAFVPQLQSGAIAQDTEIELFQKALWSAFAQCGGSAVLVASGSAESENPRAVRLGLDSAEWGSATLPPDCFLIQLLPAESDYLEKLGQDLLFQLDQYSCSDRTLVLCGRQCQAFLPLSPRSSKSEISREPGLHLGLWAVLGPSLAGEIHLGRTFSRLDATGIKRNELTFGTFRIGLLGQGEKATARTVITFTQHSRETPSRVVWLWQGAEVAHQNLLWEPQQLCVTIYLEAPYDVTWDLGHRCFRWEERLAEPLDASSEDLALALQAMVKEYNDYRPRVESQTLGCWFLLTLCCVALAGLLAPFVGSMLGLATGTLAAVALIRAEFQYRHKKRYVIGRSLELLLETLEKKKGQRLWEQARMLPNGESYPKDLAI